MKTRVMSLYGGGAVDASSVAYITVPRNGLITAILMSTWTIGAISAAGNAQFELSFSSARQPATNDAIGPIAEAEIAWSFTTSGATILSVPTMVTGVAIPVRENDRLYIHLECTGTMPATGVYTRTFLYIAE